MHLKYESVIREALVDGNKTYHQVTEDICAPIENYNRENEKSAF